MWLNREGWAKDWRIYPTNNLIVGVQDFKQLLLNMYDSSSDWRAKINLRCSEEDARTEYEDTAKRLRKGKLYHRLDLFIFLPSFSPNPLLPSIFNIALNFPTFLLIKLFYSWITTKVCQWLHRWSAAKRSFKLGFTCCKLVLHSLILNPNCCKGNIFWLLMIIWVVFGTKIRDDGVF